MPPPTEIVLLVVTGLAAGWLGGLLGIGGSIVMIPVLTLVFRHDQHVSQAAAMIVNIVVALSGTLRHHRAKAIDWSVTGRLVPAGLVFILVGVEASNQMDGAALGRVFGVFLLYVVYVTGREVLGDVRGHLKGTPRRDDDAAPPRTGWLAIGLTGAITGFAAGLLGIGGGIIAVPLLQRVNRLPLRQAIVASATMMCITAPVGAVRKNLTLPDVLPASHPIGPSEALAIAACLAPTAIVGGLIGAGFTHSLPLRWIRAVLLVLLAIACWRFLTA